MSSKKRKFDGPEENSLKRSKTTVISDSNVDFSLVIMEREYKVSKNALSYFCKYFDAIFSNEDSKDEKINILNIPLVSDYEDMIAVFFSILHNPFDMEKKEYTLLELLSLHHIASYFSSCKIIKWINTKIQSISKIEDNDLLRIVKYLNRFTLPIIKKEEILVHTTHLIANKMNTEVIKLTEEEYNENFSPAFSNYLLFLVASSYNFEQFNCCL